MNWFSAKLTLFSFPVKYFLFHLNHNVFTSQRPILNLHQQ